MTEVLSPAGGMGSLIAAVRSGADAVYFGAGSFNARRNAENFNNDEIYAAVSYCRVRGVKAYLTLNTLVTDSEMSEAVSLAFAAARAGIDAFIVQDLGLAGLLRKYLPDVPLHASTQLSVHSADALPVLKKLGFTRVVPAREMDKESLERFCRKAEELGIEVEVFVHGALCMCLSGQCYLSSVLGGRSGNRGLCAQPCRLAFATDGGTGHDLSLKDMSYIGHIGELIKMGVTSFKIEGRMKRPEYVAAATAVCRAVTDGEKIPENAAKTLDSVFSRSGHTDGYFYGKTGREMFGIRTENDEKLSAEALSLTHELYRRERQSVKINAFVKIKRGENVAITVSDGEHTVTVKGEMPTEALNVPVSEESVYGKISKLGGTVYRLDGFSADIDDGLFVPSGVLNTVKQRATDELSAARADVTVPVGEVPRDISAFKPAGDIGKRAKTFAQFKNTEQIPEDLTGIDGIILPVECDFSSASKKAQGIDLYADIPRGIMKNGDSAERSLTFAAAYVKAVFVGNTAGIVLAEKLGLPMIAAYSMNVYNSFTADELKKLGLPRQTVSFEASARQFSDMSCEGKGYIAYGRLPLMLVKSCPGKNGAGCKECGGKAVLHDRKGKDFPVMCRGEFSEVFNSVPLWVLDRENEFLNADYRILYFTDETKERAGEVISAALHGASPDCEYTRGLYYREVY